MHRRPNILWIVTTQWRGQALGCAGDPNARTPAVDALAARGVRWSAAMSPHPFGPFARAALLTGQPSPGNGVRDYYDPLPDDRETVAQALGRSGYRTGFFGKWHLGRRDPRAPLVGEAHARTPVPPSSRGGFAYWEGFESGFLLNDPWLHGTALPEPRRFAGYQSDVVADRARAWCLGGRGAAAAVEPPWFCLVSLEPPHPPYDAPSAGIAARAPAEIVLSGNVPRGGEVETRARCELAGYYAHIEATDRAIGRLVGGLAGGCTIVVITSVHGDMHGAHGLFRKGWPYEESVAVPLVVAGPAEWTLAGGREERGVVSLLDLPRWALDWAEGRAARVAEGGRLLSMPSVVPLPRQCDRRWHGIRTRTHKAVWNEDGSPWLYFDLGDDPAEMHNRAGEPSARREMEALRAGFVPAGD